ncbi:MAG: substrate-binding periplasmic protein [Pseudomonadales bacterium]
MRFSLTIRHCAVFALLTFNLALSASIHAQTLQFARIEGSFNQQVGQRLLEVIYQRLGVAVRFPVMTAKRSINESYSGHKDGEILRIAGVDKHYPNLVRIPTPLYSLKSQAFARRDAPFSITQLADIQPLRTVIVRGIMHAERLTSQANVSRLHRFESVTMLMKFVQLGRADIALSSRLNGLAIIKAQALSDIIPVGPVLQDQPLYHYVHHKNRELVPQLDRIIRWMRDSGELTTLTRKFEAQILQ